MRERTGTGALATLGAAVRGQELMWTSTRARNGQLSCPRGQEARRDA
jgi:hypothetical protein